VATKEVEPEGSKAGLPQSAPSSEKTQPTDRAAADSSRVASVQNGVASADKTNETKVYTVRPGDTLWKIAESAYGRGHGGKYRLIIEANKALLSHRGKIHPGQALRIPPPPA
jgi:nucleoid-associated protein YgaU